MKLNNLKRGYCILVMLIFSNVNLQAELIPVCTEGHIQSLPASAVSIKSGISDGTIIGFYDERENGSLFAQKLNSSGKPEWENDGILLDSYLGTSFTSDTDYPQIFSDNEGGAVIVYRKYFSVTEHIYYTRVYEDGTRWMHPICISNFYGGYNFSPVAVKKKENTIVVVWENFYQGDFNIHAQEVDFEGNRLWNRGNEVVVCDYLYDQRKPTVSVDDEGVSITWLDMRESGMNPDLYGNRLDPHGEYTYYTSRGKLILKQYDGNDNIFENNSGSHIFERDAGTDNIKKYSLYNHLMVTSGRNSFLTAIENWKTADENYITVMKVNERLDIEWSHDVNGESYQTNPLIVSDKNDGAAVIWMDGRDNERSIYGTLFDRHGNTNYSNSGLKISDNDAKPEMLRILPKDKNQNAVFVNGEIIYINWLTSGFNKIYSTQFWLSNNGLIRKESESVIDEDVFEGDCISVTAFNDKVVTVYNKNYDIFALVQTENGDKTLTAAKEELSANNFPNPFNPVTTINYNLKSPGNVRISIYDMLGKELKTLVNEFKEAGNYKIKFDGSSLSSGVYFYRLRFDEYGKTGQTKVITNRMTLIK